jgi:predicted permease
LNGLFGGRRRDQELADELRVHIELETDANVRRGMPLEEARRAALVEFGGVTQTAELYRERRGLPMVETLFQDIRYALRGFRKAPGFVAVAILSLGLGIGVNTTIFSMVNMLLLRPLPVQNPNQLVTLLYQQHGGMSAQWFSYPDYRDLRARTGSAFSDVVAFRTSLDGLSVNGRADRIVTHFVTGNYFTMLGVKPALGRLLLPGEGEVEGADAIVVLSYSYWQARFASDPNVIGQRVLVDGYPLTVVGVASKEFHGAQEMFDVQAYLPLAMSSIEGYFARGFLEGRGLRFLGVLARLRPGVTIDQVRSRLKTVGTRMAEQYPKELAGMTFYAQPERLTRIPLDGSDRLVPLSVGFLAMAALVLVLACLNLANLLLVRASARQKEMALRAALGGSRGRLMGQLLTESALLAFFGAAAGMLLSAWTSGAFRTLDLQGIPIRVDLGFDWRVLAYAIGASVAAGLILGILPAVRGARTDLSMVAREGGQRTSGERQRLRGLLVMVQVAGSFLLLVVAGLLTRSLQSAQKSDLGFDPNQVVNFRLDPRHLGYNDAQGGQFYKELLRRVRELPRVEAAGLGCCGPISASTLFAPMEIDGYTPPRGEPGPLIYFNQVSVGFFEALRIPIIQGRPFVASDDETRQRVAVISQTMAERYWPGQDPIGRGFRFVGDSRGWMRVVGVAKDGKLVMVSEPPRPYFYVPLSQNYGSSQVLRVRSGEATEAVMAEVRKEINSLAPGLPVTGVQTMQAQIDAVGVGFGTFRLGAWCAAALGLLGLALAVMGLYGVVSYAAVQRRREIGIRMALGARAGHVRRLVLGQGVVVVCSGLGAGVVLSLAVGPIVRRFLVGVSATDPVTFVCVAIALGLVALAACYVPLRRAMRVDPMVALREE